MGVEWLCSPFVAFDFCCDCGFFLGSGGGYGVGVVGGIFMAIFTMKCGGR